MLARLSREGAQGVQGVNICLASEVLYMPHPRTDFANKQLQWTPMNNTMMADPKFVQLTASGVTNCVVGKY